MVLDYLKNQEHEPSPDLLNELGWTDEDLRAFLRRWEQMKQAAQGSEEGRRQLDDALSGLGLRATSSRTRNDEGRVDQIQAVDGGAAGTEAPARYRQKFNSFRQRR